MTKYFEPTRKRPSQIDTVEKLINYDCRIILTNTEIFRRFQKNYLQEYGWYGTYKTIYYNRLNDTFCDRNYNDITYETAHEMAMRELLLRR